MSLWRTDAKLDALLVTRGHPFERGPFFEMFDSIRDISFTHPAERL